MFCKKCGNRIEQGDVFCQNCGAKVEREYEKGRKTAAVLFGILGAAILLLLGGIGWGGYTLYKLNRDIDATADFDIAAVPEASGDFTAKENFEYLLDISNDTLTGVHVGYNSDSILDSLTLIYENGGDVVQQKRIASDFTLAKASSTLEATSHSTYFPENVLDGDKNTAWIEGADGFGEGEWIELSAESAHKIYGLCIRNGCTKEEKRLIKNAQAKRIQIEFSDGSSCEYELAQTQEPDQECSNVIVFTDGPVKTSKIRIKILSVYESQDYIDPSTGECFAKDLDTAISDIYVLQWDEDKGKKKS